MTVGELIESLKFYDKDLPVFAMDVYFNTIKIQPVCLKVDNVIDDNKGLIILMRPQTNKI